MASCYESLHIPLKDGTEFISLHDETNYDPSTCDTCDFDATYTNDIRITTTNNELHVVFDNSYEYVFTTASAIKVFCTINITEMTEREFLSYLVEKFKEIGHISELKIKGTCEDIVL